MHFSGALRSGHVGAAPRLHFPMGWASLPAPQGKPAKKTKKASKKGPTKKYTAATADKHQLYQLSVQDPESEVDWITKLYTIAYGRVAVTLREDFCGTAFLAAYWLKTSQYRRAIGIDLDLPTLEWGKKHVLADLDEPGNRLQLLHQNVLEPVATKSHITLALNFSYWVFTERQVLCCVVLCCVVLGWVGLGWVGLGWVGLGRIASGGVRLYTAQRSSSVILLKGCLEAAGVAESLSLSIEQGHRRGHGLHTSTARVVSRDA